MITVRIANSRGAAFAASMVGHVFGQPLVPGCFNRSHGLSLAVVALAGFDEGDDPQISANHVRIGAVVVAYDD